MSWIIDGFLDGIEEIEEELRKEWKDRTKKFVKDFKENLGNQDQPIKEEKPIDEGDYEIIDDQEGTETLSKKERIIRKLDKKKSD